MSTLRDLARANGDLTEAGIDWLHLLVAEWHVLADLSFADLLLYIRAKDDEAFISVAQMRPTTGQTLYQDDKVGMVVSASERFLVARSWAEGRISREGEPEWHSGVPVRQEAIPVRMGDQVIAVIARDTNLAAARVPSQLEMTYLQTGSDLAQMISEGSYPFPGAQPDLEVAPRVGDGMVRLDADGLVVFASPNAISAYRRLGFSGNIVGESLLSIGDELGIDEKRIVDVLQRRFPAEAEDESGGATVLRRAVPLMSRDTVIGALVLLREVTELRRRDRQLMSKDATIREIHHRVKNNLQTVAALLRLQARRLDSPEARAALAESVRRVSSIALVHETLSQALDETVVFDDIADKVISMISDVSNADAGEIETRRVGTSGDLPAEVATPLALVLAELLQNAVEHAFGERGGCIEVRFERVGDRLRAVVADDGGGLPEEFDVTRSTRLGLQIVRTLVMTELGGTIVLGRGPECGTEVRLDVPTRLG
ncbi:MAG TPA: sensor histidine kinase [Mycobacteriales bacterium]|jgi:two-component sensor histidine kinase|nr:sensor histidine kinase [Mycobacteriales bacterium]